MGFRKVSGNCVFLIETIGPTAGVNAPSLVVGRVVPTNTGGREPTQDPMTGFVCDGTPLGRGHIVALFLGGPDIPENYAPQYEQWQQCGAWKAMEMGIGTEAQGMPMGVQLYMAVWLTYGLSGNNYGVQKMTFNGGDYLSPWTEFQIPSRFQVATFRSDATGANAVVADLFGADEGKAIAAFGKLASQAFLTVKGDFDHSVMPPEDYRFWSRNLIRKWAQEAAEKAKAEYQTYVAAQISTAAGKTKTGRIGRHEQGVIEDKGRKLYGYDGNLPLSDGRWKLDNLAKVATHVQAKLDSRVDHYRFTPVDYATLKSGAATATIHQMLI